MPRPRSDPPFAFGHQCKDGLVRIQKPFPGGLRNFVGEGALVLAAIKRVVARAVSKRRSPLRHNWFTHFGYFTVRSQVEKMAAHITMIAKLGQLASGPKAPPVSHAGP